MLSKNIQNLTPQPPFSSHCPPTHTKAEGQMQQCFLYSPLPGGLPRFPCILSKMGTPVLSLGPSLALSREPNVGINHINHTSWFYFRLHSLKTPETQIFLSFPKGVHNSITIHSSFYYKPRKLSDSSLK